jgi:hypothetical protein
MGRGRIYCWRGRAALVRSALCAGCRAWRITRAVDCRSGTKGRRPWCSLAPIARCAGGEDGAVRISARHSCAQARRHDGAVRASRAAITSSTMRG